MWALFKARADALQRLNSTAPGPPLASLPHPETLVTPLKRSRPVSSVTQPPRPDPALAAQHDLYHARLAALNASPRYPTSVPIHAPAAPVVIRPLPTARLPLAPVSTGPPVLSVSPLPATLSPLASPAPQVASQAPEPLSLPSSAIFPPPAAALSSEQFVAALAAALLELQGPTPALDDDSAGQRIADEITASWLGVDELLQKELAQFLLDPCFLPSSSNKYADAPASATLARENDSDIPTGAFPLALDHSRRLSFAFAKSISRATRLSFLTPVPPPVSSGSPLHQFSDTVKLKHQQLLYRSILKSGVEAHAGRVLRYLGFCEEEGIPVEDVFPARPENVLMFLSTLGGLLRVPTIGAYANSIRWWHTIHGLPFQMDEEHFRVLKQGLAQVQPGPNEPRPPVSTLDLILLRDGLRRDVADPNHILEQPEADCIWAAATAAFHGMARSCDVTLGKQGSFDRNFDLSARDVRFYQASDKFAEHVTLTLPFDKVKRRKGALLYLMRQASDPRLDPVQAMAAHFASNDLQEKDTFAFSFIATRDSRTVPKGGLVTLTNSYFIKTVNAYLVAGGRSRIWGHSFRIGGATMYLLAGKHIDSIRVIGRWSSNAFDRYWRDIRIIAANHLADAEYVTTESDDPVSFSAILDGSDPEPPSKTKKKASKKSKQ
ncbi:hypothetical protein P7C70_g8631, partial [Phenoliferia sp. Uapishka_3]